MNSSRRPVYVLGAGFSKAISKAMPITNELGDDLERRLSGEIEFDRKSKETFEAWLTLQMTPLPFLEGFENSRRAADAARVISEMAHVLDERVLTASEEPAPLWLRQIIAIWHVERAVVLTFNYDTLIERAVNGVVPSVVSENGFVGHVMGDQVVFPAPPAPQAQYIGDFGAGYTGDSFELLKMHGSLTWYWASGDPTGSTLIRVREKHILGSSEPLAIEADFSGATTLDRYLIPPITSKDGYYGSYLANALWRTAGSRISSAESLALIGYSLPPEDRVACQLIAQVPKDAPVSVIDRAPGDQANPRSLLGNLSSLGISAGEAATGEDCVASFVSDKLRAAIEKMPESPAFDQLENSDADVVVAVSGGWGTHDSNNLFVLAWNDEASVFESHAVGYSYMQGSDTHYRESVLNEMPRGFRKLEDFVTASWLHEYVGDCSPFTFRHPRSGETLVAIGTTRLKIERREVLEIKWAPYSL